MSQTICCKAYACEACIAENPNVCPVCEEISPGFEESKYEIAIPCERC